MIKYFPQDKIAKAKLRLCQQELNRIEFEKAIESEQTKPVSEQLNPMDIAMESGAYEGKALDEASNVTLEFLQDIMDRMRDQKKLPKRYDDMFY